MKIVKTRLEGDEVVVSLPEDEGYQVRADQEYQVIYGDNGVINLIPKITNPYLNHETGALYEPDVWADMKPVGKEILDQE